MWKYILASVVVICISTIFVWLFSLIPDYDWSCGNIKAVSVETVCEGVIGCNYTYKMDNGSIIQKQEFPAHFDENGNYCLWEEIKEK